MIHPVDFDHKGEILIEEEGSAVWPVVFKSTSLVEFVCDAEDMESKLGLLIICQVLDLNKLTLQVDVDTLQIIAGLFDVLHDLNSLLWGKAWAKREPADISLDAAFYRVNHPCLLLLVVKIFLHLFLVHHLLILRLLYALYVGVLLVNLEDYVVKKLREGAIGVLGVSLYSVP